MTGKAVQTELNWGLLAVAEVGSRHYGTDIANPSD